MNIPIHNVVQMQGGLIDCITSWPTENLAKDYFRALVVEDHGLITVADYEKLIESGYYESKNGKYEIYLIPSSEPRTDLTE